jgi:hypothetical protein
MGGFGTPEILLLLLIIVGGVLFILVPIVIAFFWGKRLGRLEGRLEERNRQ